MYLTLTNQIVQVGVTAGKLPDVPLKGRDEVVVQNVGNIAIYLGNTAVTADTAGTGGYLLLPRAGYVYKYAHTVDIYGVVSTGSGQVLVQEGK